jgi:hypothetical protein
MHVIPGKIYAFRLAGRTFKVLWYWHEDSDDEQFFLQLLESNVGYGAVGNVLEFIEQLPYTGSYEATEALLTKAIAKARPS